MTYKGIVKNGVVVLPPEAKLADGTEVLIDRVAEDGPTFAEQMREFIGIVKDAPPDLAVQHDHYIHGTPKRDRE